MKKLIFATITVFSFFCSAFAQTAQETFFINGCLGAGTFSAGDDYGGSVFLGGSISTDWIPNEEKRLSYGFETGLLGGNKLGDIIFGVPMIFRFGWHPVFLKFSNVDMFILGKAGWAVGIWGQNPNEGSTSNNGVVCGFNFGGRYKLTQSTGIYTEIGYNYYGLARNRDYPEYPLGYGSGKTYASIGISHQIKWKN